jgi:hypothetical protein
VLKGLPAVDYTARDIIYRPQAEAEGLEPTKEWVKDLIDEILADEFASPDLELAWLDEDDGDPETVLEGLLKVGAVTLNEMRDALGLDPYDNAAADRPMVLTATGGAECVEVRRVCRASRRVSGRERDDCVDWRSDNSIRTQYTALHIWYDQFQRQWLCDGPGGFCIATRDTGNGLAGAVQAQYLRVGSDRRVFR